MGEEKVQSLDWHPKEASNLLSGGCDKTARLFDCRSPSDCHKTWRFPAEVEKVLFDPFSPMRFVAATDEGNLYSIDCRQQKPLFTLAAHSDAITAVDFSPSIRDCCATSSMDKTVKVWDLRDSKPECVVEKNFKIGPMHCAKFCPDAPLVLAVGGNKGCFRLWDAKKAAAVKERWKEELENVEKEEEEEEKEERKGGEERTPMEGVKRGENDDDSDDSDDDDDDDADNDVVDEGVVH